MKENLIKRFYVFDGINFDYLGEFDEKIIEKFTTKFVPVQDDKFREDYLLIYPNNLNNNDTEDLSNFLIKKELSGKYLNKKENHDFKLYLENGFIYMSVNKKIFEELGKIAIEHIFTSEANVIKIRLILNMQCYNNIELIGLRNSIVKGFSMMTNDDCERLMMITAVIDDEKFRRGMAV